MLKLRWSPGVIVIASLVGCANEDSWDGIFVPKEPAPKPNVILIVIDTARADHFSSYGYDHPTTPKIDALALDSVRFSNAHSVAPWTLPAHMSMFTGLLPGQHGATWEAFSQPPEMSLRQILNRRFSPNSNPQQMLTSRLKASGYRTWGFSANVWVGRRTGFDKGFDDFFEVWRQGVVSKFFRLYPDMPSDLKINADYDQTTTGRSIALFKNQVVADRSGQPFFAFFNLMDPHYPYAPPYEFLYEFGGNSKVFAKTQQSKEVNELALLGGYKPFALKELIPFYDAELNYVDFMIGNMIDWLRRNNLYDESLIIVTSDHGEHLGENGRFSHQLSIEEELLAIPLIIKYPGSAHAGVVIDSPLVSNIDVYETIISVAGGAVEATQNDTFSVDLTSLITQGEIKRQSLFSELYFSGAYLRQITLQYALFDQSLHNMVRRAVYLDGHKIVFEDLSQVSIEPLGTRSGQANKTPDSAAIQTAMYNYVSSIGDFRMQDFDGTTEDREFFDRLESLGYLDGGTKPQLEK